jgi:hypothetical protein
LDQKVPYTAFTGANIASVIGTNPVQRAISDGNGNNIPNTYVAKSSLGASDGVATLDSNKKLSFSQIPDSLLGQLMYGGTINGAGVCSLSDNFKEKYGITSLTITENAPNSYSSVYFVATAQGAIAATEGGVYPAIEYMTGDWIVSAGSSGYNKVDNTDAVQGVKGDADTEYKVGYVNLTPADIGSLSTQESYNNLGKLIQLDFTGTLSGNAITFTLSNPADEVALIDNNTYEIDLHFPAAGTILGSNTIVIHYGAANTEIKLYNVLNKSGTMTVADMKQIETYSSDTGWRWIFNAIYNNTSGALSLTIPATVVRSGILAMSDEDLLTHIGDADLEDGQLVFISSVGAGNGYYLGHTYRVSLDRASNTESVSDVTMTYNDFTAGLKVEGKSVSNIDEHIQNMLHLGAYYDTYTKDVFR